MERPLSDTCHGIPYCGSGEVGTVPESVPFDSCNGIGDGDRSEAGTFSES